MSVNNLEEVIMKSCDLPTMPAVANRVVMLVSDPDTTADMLNKAIMADQAMAARVLKLANSSFYGCLRSVNTLTQAIMIIGFTTIKNIVLAASTKEVYKRFGLTEKMLHEHSTGVAMAAYHIAKEAGLKNMEEAFLLGLLHDIGKVVLNNGDAEKYRTVMETVYNSDSSFDEAEMDVYGFTHADVGALVVRKWNFAPEMERVVSSHHNIEKVEDDPYVTQLVAIINLADAFCYKLGIGTREAKEIDIVGLKASSCLKLDAARLEKIEAAISQSHEEGGDIL